MTGRAIAAALMLMAQLPATGVDRIDVTRYPDGRPASVQAWRGNRKAGSHAAWWPSGAIRLVARYDNDAYDGEYRTFYETGRPYELRHYSHGREAGLQQSWTADGVLFLNYEMRDGRRYGMVNARPCETVEKLPYYDTADFTPRWSSTPARTVEFTLTSQLGTPVGARDLRGQIHVASFIFTRCSAICPALVRQLKRVQGEEVRLVSYSVTPDLDTPDALAAYGAREGIDPARWLLLTGDRNTVFRLAREFYFADDRRLEPTTGGFLHTEKVLLVDEQGRLRGVYNGTVPFDVERLLTDIRSLRGTAAAAPINP
jgi:protein SCO1/2